MERKMATIRSIDAIDPIEGADAIEVCTVGGWKVVAQKGIHEVGSYAIYCEVDSFVPSTVAPFLTRPGHFPKVYNGVEGERLRTIKLRGQISQGLLLPLSVLGDYYFKSIVHPNHWVKGDLRVPDEEGADVSELLGIVKWEPPLSPQLEGIARGVFPSFIRKTDQERCQNLKHDIEGWYDGGLTWEITEKLDGSSMTVFLNDGVFGVCSRNLELKEDETNTFWKVARELKLEEKMREIGGNFAIQGELIGVGIQKNPYQLTGHEFHLYDVWDITAQCYMVADVRDSIALALDCKHVPVIVKRGLLNTSSIDELLLFAEGKSALNPKTEREGLVFKCCENPMISFKAISNKFLMKEKD